MKWDRITGASGYIVKFNNTIYNASASASSYQITGLKSKTTYSYQVCAKSVDGNGSYSSAKSITTQPQLPSVPTGITKKSTENTATIDWYAVSGATGYDVLFNGSVSSVTTNSKTITGLSANKGYTFQVRAKNADGVSAYSTAMTVTTAPKAPTTMSATSAIYSVTVNWGAVSGATGYIIRFNNSDYPVTGTSKTFTGLRSKTNYTYQMCSKNADGAGNFNTSKTIQTLPALP